MSEQDLSNPLGIVHRDHLEPYIGTSFWEFFPPFESPSAPAVYEAACQIPLFR